MSLQELGEPQSLLWPAPRAVFPSSEGGKTKVETGWCHDGAGSQNYSVHGFQLKVHNGTVSAWTSKSPPEESLSGLLCCDLQAIISGTVEVQALTLAS